MALVLCTGLDPNVMKTRQLILEHAGHEVVLASDDRSVAKACESHQFAVAVIGQNTSPAVKQRYLRLIREHCSGTKILELHRPFSDKALAEADAWLVMPAESPEHLAHLVTSLAQKAKSVGAVDGGED